ncbi:DUF7793 family protein [Luteibaculum oceani]|uniref:DUF7793 domain-containing protein n=1 Tax=Luteibaculum oceani TaxID=1294296 RepID=A0A5C6VIR5_9FLAO|nr:hypothetical protein [Luteibaculum oceani]TXC85313.1 hypothetical protein FRX97_01425 [Luteibaculum oceani]
MDYNELFSQEILPHPGAKIKTDISGIQWFSPDGLFISVPWKNVPESTIEFIKESERQWAIDHGDEKIAWLTIVNPQTRSSKEVRDYMAEILPKYIKALAMVNYSPLGRMAANLFFGIKRQDYPVKMFSNVESALKWIKPYL